MMYTYDVCPDCDCFVKVEVPRDIALAIECPYCGAAFYVDYGPGDELGEAFRDAG